MSEALEETLSARRRRIVVIARGWLGTPYLHQASAKGQGADCLGLVRGVWRELYGEEPERPPAYGRTEASEAMIAAARRNLAPTRRPRAGAVLFFRIERAGPVRHCGVMTEGERFLHAYAGRGVIESPLSRFWIERLVAAFDFPGTEN
jgi:NlpC/P60 family putative phage cell wall peptidase